MQAARMGNVADAPAAPPALTPAPAPAPAPTPAPATAPPRPEEFLNIGVKPSEHAQSAQLDTSGSQER
jgi:hypothetical protein